MSGSEFPKPADPQEQPGFDDSLNDLEREYDEKTGAASLPVKTWKFWLSLVGVVLGFVLLSGALVPSGTAAQVVVFVAALLGHLGYGLARDPEASTERNYQKRGFWLSIGAYAVSFLLGSGLDGQSVEQITGIAALILGYFGYSTRAWIQRDKMVSPVQWPKFLEGILRFVLGYNKREDK